VGLDLILPPSRRINPRSSEKACVYDLFALAPCCVWLISLILLKVNLVTRRPIIRRYPSQFLIHLTRLIRVLIRLDLKNPL
jgi:hypothetical protein